MDDDRSSPCSAGGLHMPNSKSMKDFAKRVQRLRHHSQCTTDSDPHETSGSSPEIDSGKVRRANSCPEMKKSPVSSIKDNVSRTLDETDEEEAIENASNGVILESLKNVSAETQTDNFWPMPYEHLFLGIFPSLGTDVKSSPGPVSLSLGSSQEKNNQPSIYEVLDRYVDTAIRDTEKDDVRELKNQLKLVHQQLLFERHRREIHAFKNRRFLADAKNTQVLEEHNSALRDQVQLQQNDVDTLRSQLEHFQIKKDIENRRLDDIIFQLEDKYRALENKNKVLLENEEDFLEKLEDYKSKYILLAADKQKAEAKLLDAIAEVKFAKEQALAGEKGRAELENVNRQLVLIGELQLKYKERLEELSSLRRSDQELVLRTESYNNDIKNMRLRFRDKSTKLEACISKIAELEQTIRQNEEVMASHKRIINSLNEETEEKLKILGSKYKTQLTINRSLEEKILEMYKLLETSTRKPVCSPDTSSCQEVHVSSDKVSGASALSQRSSPLSCSLTSSDGSLMQSEVNLKSLQAFADEETASDAKTEIFKDLETEPSTSGTKK